MVIADGCTHYMTIQQMQRSEEKQIYIISKKLL